MPDVSVPDVSAPSISVAGISRIPAPGSSGQVFAVCPEHIGDGRTAFSYRTGLVEHDDIGFFCYFDTLGILYEYTVPCRLDDTHHYCRRGRKPQCAWTGYDKHGHERKEGMGHTFGRVSNQPDDGRKEGYAYYHRNKNGCDFVYEPLHRSLASLGIPHQRYYPGQKRALPYFFRLEIQRASPVHASGKHFFAGIFV